MRTHTFTLPGDRRLDLSAQHRTFEDIFAALHESGFAVTRLLEPQPRPELVNPRNRKFEANLFASVYDIRKAERLLEAGLGVKACTIRARRNQRVEKLDLSADIGRCGARHLMLWLELEVEGEAVSTNFPCEGGSGWQTISWAE